MLMRMRCYSLRGIASLFSRFHTLCAILLVPLVTAKIPIWINALRSFSLVTVVVSLVTFDW